MARQERGETVERSRAKFLFSSRRQHTRSLRDWSSDVCSSDLPRRTLVLAAKAAIVTGLVLVAAAVGVAGSMIAGRLMIPSLALDDRTVLRAAGGSVLYLGLIALLALGIATMVRDTAVAIGAVLGLLFLFPILAGLATDPHWQRRLQQIGPMPAGLAIQATTHLEALPIGPWPGLGVLALWSFGAVAVGAVFLEARDA